MNLGYYKSPVGNIGDDLNGYMWGKVLNKKIITPDDSLVFIGIGSILDDRYSSYEKKVVFGSGARDKISVPKLDNSWDVRFCRGPKTVNALDLDDCNYITDPALLVAELYRYPQVKKRIGFIPYYKSNERFWKQLADELNFIFISPRLPVDCFLEKINMCNSVITEAMHGAILADSYRIPWFPVSSLTYNLESDTHFFKWRDWCESVNLNFKELILPEVYDVESSVKNNIKNHIKKIKIKKEILNIIKKEEFFLTSDVIYDDRINRLFDAIDLLNCDYG